MYFIFSPNIPSLTYNEERVAHHTRSFVRFQELQNIRNSSSQIKSKCVLVTNAVQFTVHEIRKNLESKRAKKLDRYTSYTYRYSTLQMNKGHDKNNSVYTVIQISHKKHA